MDMIVRPSRREDIPALQIVLDGVDLFPSDILPGMISAYFSEEQSEDIWLTCEANSKAIGFCYARPEEMADGVWNMLAIAVLSSSQGSGAGSAIIRKLESDLHLREQRILIADTSGAEAYTQTRIFYRKNGYTEEARIRDFWADGDDKVTFWKSLRQK